MTTRSCLVSREIIRKNSYSGPYRNFKYRIVETPRSVKLLESFLGTETVMGQVSGWKRSLFVEIARFLQDKDERERGYRLFLALKVLRCIDDRRKMSSFLKAMNEITLEEAIFWVWQYHSYGKAALNAFNCIHMNSCKRGIAEIENDINDSR
jgi:hypothetical protein